MQTQPPRTCSSTTRSLLTRSLFSDSSSDDDYVYTVETKKHGGPRTKDTLRVNHVPITFIVDTGATIDLIDSNTFERVQHKVTLIKSNTKVYAYSSDTPLKLRNNTK